jgi:hypothetical protein
MGQILPVDFKEIGQSIQKLLSGNKIQDGCHGGHIGKSWDAGFRKKKNRLNGPSTPCRFYNNRSKH